MVRTFRALQGAHEVGARFAPGAHLGGRHGALRGAQDWCAPRSAPKCAPRKLLNGAHHWCAPKCAPKLSPAACTCPGRAPRPRPASLTCPGRLVRNLRVRNITVHLGQRARLDRARTGRGAPRFHLGARAAPRAHRGAPHNARVAPWPVCAGCLGCALGVAPRARGSAGKRTPARPGPDENANGQKVYSNSIATPGRKTKKGCNTGTSRRSPIPVLLRPKRAYCGVLMGSGALTLV
ncbi:hypothetical protein SUGI_1302980 [Cryptomeria japonica]|uniref:Uncharacterized protein n=1 Tax=Cryptomeria japonica TaxID=3369 RepID=A0AAD3RQ19_CRYJA|nr:hypothetical protein SUGI_1302980 [Cryptomeria japonica]